MISEVALRHTEGWREYIVLTVSTCEGGDGCIFPQFVYLSVSLQLEIHHLSLVPLQLAQINIASYSWLAWLLTVYDLTQLSVLHGPLFSEQVASTAVSVGRDMIVCKLV